MSYRLTTLNSLIFHNFYVTMVALAEACVWKSASGPRYTDSRQFIGRSARRLPCNGFNTRPIIVITSSALASGLRELHLPYMSGDVLGTNTVSHIQTTSSNSVWSTGQSRETNIWMKRTEMSDFHQCVFTCACLMTSSSSAMVSLHEWITTNCFSSNISIMDSCEKCSHFYLSSSSSS